MNKIQPFVTLVGAGPGDPDLITLKGVKAIACADVILYDALVNDALLSYARPNCTKVYVGKRAERLSTSQDYINRLMVDYALTHGHVVRLKGGDSFVFGRGGEELDYVHGFGIPTAVIPGISSAIGLTGIQKIPLTYRGVSESFWVITGSKSDGSLSSDLKLATGTNATVVVLMGYGKLQEIVSLYESCGKSTLPIAVIQNGSLPHERIVLGTMGSIVEAVESAGVGVPAVIVIGEVVRKHAEFGRIRDEINYLQV